MKIKKEKLKFQVTLVVRNFCHLPQFDYLPPLSPAINVHFEYFVRISHLLLQLSANRSPSPSAVGHVIC